MAEGIDKLLDRLPAAEGDLRRRLTGGGLVLISLAAVFLQRAEIMDIAGLKPADLIRSPTLLIVFLLAVYAVGHVTDMIAETFVLRVGSNIVWGYSSPFNFDKSEKPWLFWPLVRPIVAPLGIYLGVFSGFVGESQYKWRNIRNYLSKEARKYFDDLPEIAQQGFIEPFTNRIEVSWWFLQSRSRSHERRRLSKLEARNKDILCIFTALLPVSGILLFYCPLGQFFHNLGDVALFLFLTHAMLFILVILFANYWRILRYSIVVALEVVSHAPEARDNADTTTKVSGAG